MVQIDYRPNGSWETKSPLTPYETWPVGMKDTYYWSSEEQPHFSHYDRQTPD